jgi:hypothetical protein
MYGVKSYVWERMNSSGARQPAIDNTTNAFPARQPFLYFLAIAHAWILPSPCVHRVGAPNSFFEAQCPAHRCLCLRFACCLTTAYAKLEVGTVRYSFPVRLFHSLLHAGLSRRTDTHCFSGFSFNGCPNPSFKSRLNSALSDLTRMHSHIM